MAVWGEGYAGIPTGQWLAGTGVPLNEFER